MRTALAVLVIAAVAVAGLLIAAVIYAYRSDGKCKERFGEQARYWGPGTCVIEHHEELKL